MLKARVLELHPEWTDRCDVWDAKTGRVPLVTRFMEMCRHKTRCHTIAEFAVPAGKRSAALMCPHRGKDCKDTSRNFLTTLPTPTPPSQ
jgi:hypothetical protein